MTTLTDPPKASFRLSMLLYDTRYRSTTIQVIALLGFMLGAAWLVNNVIVNLAASGKTFDFGFLWEPAGYDINQKLIEYNSQSTHARAAVVGLLNTLLVAIMGCITATIIGVFIGILRLSKNWIISRLAAFYVEALRNVPVLLWIILVMAVAIEFFPAPRAFKGENPEATMKFFDTIAVTNRGVFLPKPQFTNSLGEVAIFWDSIKLNLDALAVIVVLIAGIWGSILIKRRADVIQEATGDRPITWYWQLLSILGPFIAVLWFLGFHFVYPELKGFSFKGGIHMRNSLLALWLALSLYTGAFIAENVRAGIMAISKGQAEAAAALGLRSGKIMRLVILPQALRVIVPPLISQYLNLTKNSSLAIAVGYMDITGTLGGITLNQTGREMECLLLLMACYLIISLSISSVMNYYNERTKLRER
ncbi:MAG TPA: ABC transporter permease subunit [Gammaproteobacteria bacterium]|nr:ABC transporter permease subunit [Gammaproteobacteria bacterium]